ncbi:MAG: GxxExxY protein [Candidatus Celaenobacter polaris]|nr:GxxExxY protein [Candidatus Celaenobacter polaris]
MNGRINFNINLIELLNRVNQNALIIELINNGFQAEKEYPIVVYYKCKKVGEYFADILIEKKIIWELKAEEKLNLSHQAQIINYLNATNIKVGLLIYYIFCEFSCDFVAKYSQGVK